MMNNSSSIGQTCVENNVADVDEYGREYISRDSQKGKRSNHTQCGKGDYERRVFKFPKTPFLKPSLPEKPRSNPSIIHRRGAPQVYQRKMIVSPEIDLHRYLQNKLWKSTARKNKLKLRDGSAIYPERRTETLEMRLLKFRLTQRLSTELGMDIIHDNENKNKERECASTDIEAGPLAVPPVPAWSLDLSDMHLFPPLTTRDSHVPDMPLRVWPLGDLTLGLAPITSLPPTGKFRLGI